MFDTLFLVIKRKGGFIISDLNLNYTSEMEKAMYQSHGVGYAEYERKLNHRLKVERNREHSHKEGQQVKIEMDRLVHR
ncbi:hypothetical protein [Aquibacillus albus]|uniref:Uncharacterized protein n=1 Tax=Aquibacillus albus TaxID=1168171 RepID=A0ABS2MYL9_9BACI|nr:hypothetical protein [Aquibacillus albus]MBM7570981.1 hypothetical protein [Aquibacillus albus]